MAPSVSAAAPATRRRSPVVVSGRWKHTSRSVPAAPRNASLHSSTTPSSSSTAAEDADAGAHSASRFGHRRASATISSTSTIISAAASASSSPGTVARKLPTVTVRISGSESSTFPPSPRARTSILVSATQSVSARVDNFGPAILAVVSEGHRANRSAMSAFASAGASGSSFEPQPRPVRCSPPSVISNARRFAHWRNTVRTASSSMFAAAPTASLARFRVKSPTRCAARGMALHAPRVTSTSASSLSTGTTPCAAAVWPSRLGRSAPGSAQTHRSADCTSQQNCTVPGRSAPRLDAAAAATRAHGAVGRGSEGGHSTRRWRRPGRWRVTTAVSMSSAGPATAGVGAVGRGTGGGRGPDLGRGAEDELGGAPRVVAEDATSGREARDGVGVRIRERHAERLTRRALLRRGLEDVGGHRVVPPRVPRLGRVRPSPLRTVSPAVAR